ncbi:hypothetical protein GLGCALEP_04740 [Pseudomonas sp. MM221]|nr:hypothetical protein DBADOPDK_04623 [Pseudomonas sp. MM223]CAI3807945.1 hypothetical protein GLGCALEP_04740 [Pseudomonas sp. MM221]
MKRTSRLSARAHSKYASLLLLSCASFAAPAAIVAPGNSHTVEEGDPAEFWEARFRAELIMNANSEATSQGSSANAAIVLTGKSRLIAKGATITAEGTGIVINDSSAELTDGTVVTATDNNPGNMRSGSALAMFEGSATVRDSTLNGERHAIAVLSDTRGLGRPSVESVLDISGSRLISTTGSAIYVGKLNAREEQAAKANITLRDGTVVSASNGTLLEVQDDSLVDLAIENSDITGNIISADAATTNVLLKRNAILRGAMNGVDSVGVDTTASWVVTADSSIDQLRNSGTVAFSDGEVGRTLTVHGDYVGDNGTLVFNSVLGDDGSLTDKLIVEGDTSGSTSVKVNNLGGSGAKTLNGIELITVGGNSDGKFTQAGRIVAGSYDYKLIKGTDGNWYLSNELCAPDCEEPGPGPGPDPEPDPVLIIRPEGGAYAANLYAMNTLFDASIGQRGGDTVGAGAQANDGHSSNLWMKNSGGHSRATDASGQLNTHSSRYALLLGSDLMGGTLQDGSAWRAGAFAGYGYSSGSSTSQITNYHAGHQVKGYTTGVYGTWYADGSSDQGLYTDAVLQYSWFDAQVTGEGVAKESYTAKGVSTSLEAGYVLRNEFGEGHAWYLQPKAKVTWSGVTPDDHREDNGTIVSAQGSDTLSISVGARAYLQLDTHSSDSFKPFVETNWIHNNRQAGVSLDGVSVSQAGTRNIGEFKVGAEGHINRNLSVSASLAQQVGSDSYTDTAASLALRLAF